MPPQSSSPRRVSLEWASVWALAATIIIATVLVIPIVATPTVPTKAFALASGVLVTLAVWILARLSRGNIIFPPAVLLLALWLPTLAYALSAAFSGGPFAAALWGTALEGDTLGFVVTLSALGTLTALVVRRPDHYRAFFRASSLAFAAFVALSALIVLVGQFAPSLVAPSFSLIGSGKDLAVVLGLGIILILLAARFLDLGSGPVPAVSPVCLNGGHLGSALATGLHLGPLDVRPSWRSTLLVGSQVYSHAPL